MTNNIHIVIQVLKEIYPNSKVSLEFTSPWQLLVATILSAQSTDAIVNKVTSYYFKQFPKIKDTVDADISKIEEIVRPCGLYIRKAKNIKECAIKLNNEHKSKVPDDMKHLLNLPGVGRKTANVILGVVYNIASGIVVDTHVKRLSKLLGWTREINPNKIEKNLVNIIPKKDWIILSHLLIDHGRNICNAKKPLCLKCLIEPYCPSSKLK